MPYMDCNDAAAVPPEASPEAGGPAQLPPQCSDVLRILLVVDDLICLQTIVSMSRVCNYEVTSCECGVDAVEILRGNKNEFDVVLSDLQVPDINGSALQEIVESEMGLPLIFITANDADDIVKNGFNSLTKPLSFEDLKNVRDYVHRKKEKSACLEDSRGSKVIEEREYSSGTKKRVIWVPELHQQFVEAVNKLGIERAVPKKILELMNIPGLTRENVASHLQKYRLYLRKRNEKENQDRDLTHFQGAPDPYYHQDVASYGQLPLPSTTTHSFPLTRATNVCMDITNIGEDNFYNPYVPDIMPTTVPAMNMTPSLGTSSLFLRNPFNGHDHSSYSDNGHGFGQQMYFHGVPDHNLHENCTSIAYGTYPHVNSFEVPNLAYQGGENAVPDYDTSNELPQSRNQDMELQNVNHSYRSGQIFVTAQNNVGTGPSISGHQDFPGTNEQNNMGIGPSTSGYHDGHIINDYGQGQGSGQDELDALIHNFMVGEMQDMSYINMNTVDEDGDP